jgi:hypothetical protein
VEKTLNLERLKTLVPYGQLAAVVVTSAVGIDKLIEAYSEPGPAITFKSAVIQLGTFGEKSKIVFEIVKHRATCQPDNATVSFKLKDGVTASYNVDTWASVGGGEHTIRAVFDTPERVLIDYNKKPYFQVTYKKCEGRDDVNPTEPATCWAAYAGAPNKNCADKE